MSEALDPVPVLHVEDDKIPIEDDTDVKRSGGIQFVSSISKDEPVVTRRELWSYYCASTCYVREEITS